MALTLIQLVEKCSMTTVETKFIIYLGKKDAFLSLPFCHQNISKIYSANFNDLVAFHQNNIIIVYGPKLDITIFVFVWNFQFSPFDYNFVFGRVRIWYFFLYSNDTQYVSFFFSHFFEHNDKLHILLSSCQATES